MTIGIILAATVGQPAHAARSAHLVTTIEGPSDVEVYEVASYTVIVGNEGTRRADLVELVIDLPLTHTSPTVHVLGEVTALDSRCLLDGLQIVCDLGRIGKAREETVSFDLALPASTLDLELLADATSASRHTSEGDVWLADLQPVGVSWTAPHRMTIEHCTGQDLSSFFECEVSPGSISSHAVTLQPDGTLLFDVPGYAGSWWSTGADHMALQYTDTTSTVVMSFEGVGVDPDCWEGQASFPTNPSFMAMYSVCE
ncbi:MAG: hypothetical protein KTR31_06115 [Myxococcales bacterium]|nr:hypothetical protein [Myxococcales bacterium]